MILEKDIKEKYKKIRKLIKKEIKKPIPKISEAKFDVWKSATKSFAKEIELNYFINHLSENRPNISNIYQGLEVIKILEEASNQILK